MRLIFVYNIDNNLFSLITGAAHKLASPDTYPCRLCALTYPLAAMDEEWKKFIEALPYQSMFLHRDDFNEQYPDQNNTPLPAIFIENTSGIYLLVSSEEIRKVKNISELIKAVKYSLLHKNRGQKIKVEALMQNSLTINE